MNGKNWRNLPTPLARGRNRFRAWRRTRKVGTRIPDRLWALAVRLAAVHGLCRTASVLGLDYYSLKKRMNSTDSSKRPPTSPAFVELSPPSLATTGECTIELEDEAGASMRMHLKGYDAPDLAALGHRFWHGE